MPYFWMISPIDNVPFGRFGLPLGLPGFAVLIAACLTHRAG